MEQQNWYVLDKPEEIDSPALLVYPERIQTNIAEMIRIVGHPDRLVPHVKTHKMAAVVRLQIAAGINRFKCATIAEAEMLAEHGARTVLLAYPLHAPKARRFLRLIKLFPKVAFAALVDQEHGALTLDKLAAEQGVTVNVFIDLDNGMHRTGFPVTSDIAALYRTVHNLSHLQARGLHVYDGHIRAKDFEQRKRLTRQAFLPVEKAVEAIQAEGLPQPEVIAGGSPTFTVHALNDVVHCSPGTCLLWDKGYSDLLTEQPFLPAAVLLTRIISKPMEGRITTDLGHKSVAAENPLDKRVWFFNLKTARPCGQSEEHLVLEVDAAQWQQLEVGDVLYGLPYHICPTVALYDEVQVVKSGRISATWPVTARTKKITI